jgi:hypothetical protein
LLIPSESIFTLSLTLSCCCGRGIQFSQGFK